MTCPICSCFKGIPLEPKRAIKGALTAIVFFGVVGTVSVLWENPIIKMRMVSSGNAEIALLAILSVLIGVFVAIRRPICGLKKAGLSGFLGILGVSCPVCNPLFAILIGSQATLTYFEPIRIYVAAIGVVVALFMVVKEIMAIKKGCGA